MQVRLNSLILLALPEYSADSEFNVLPSMHAVSADGKQRDDVDIVALNCKTKEDILPHLEKMLNTFRELPQQAVVVQNIKTVERWLNEIRAGLYEHDVPSGLLDAVCRASRMQLRREQMIYLSGATHLA